jgi:hypothetical protein
MNGQHPIVLAMVRKHLAEAELTLARLESQARAVPATTRSSNSMLLLTRKIREAKDVLAAWVSVERQARS